MELSVDSKIKDLYEPPLHNGDAHISEYILG
jgi:hypothetical protein